MGMRINTGSGIDPQMVEKLAALEHRPVEQLQERKKVLEDERKLFTELTGYVTTLGTALNKLKNPTDFYKLKAESSHPDIVSATVDNNAVIGNYEIEIKNIAKTHKLLAEAFPDKDKTPVGFGYMTIETEDGNSFDVDIDPSASTLQDVVSQINASNANVKALIINTKEYLNDKEQDSYRLLVISNKSGKEAKVYIDPDTTFLEFKEQVTGKNLEMLFEDVPVFDEDNNVEALMPGLVLNVKRAEPGTKININISYDAEKTAEEIKAVVEAYNKVNDFVDKQFQINPETNKAGPLAKDNTLRHLRRSLQDCIQYRNLDSKIGNLAEVGIITDAKTGALKLDETKLKQKLSEDYVEVAELFARSNKGNGFAPTMSDKIKAMQNQQSGLIASRDREYKRIFDNFDKDIANKERFASQRAESIKKRFASLEQLMAGMNAQGQALKQHFGDANAG